MLRCFHLIDVFQVLMASSASIIVTNAASICSKVHNRLPHEIYRRSLSRVRSSPSCQQREQPAWRLKTRTWREDEEERNCTYVRTYGTTLKKWMIYSSWVLHHGCPTSNYLMYRTFLSSVLFFLHMPPTPHPRHDALSRSVSLFAKNSILLLRYEYSCT